MRRQSSKPDTVWHVATISTIRAWQCSPSLHSLLTLRWIIGNESTNMCSTSKCIDSFGSSKTAQDQFKITEESCPRLVILLQTAASWPGARDIRDIRDIRDSAGRGGEVGELSSLQGLKHWWFWCRTGAALIQHSFARKLLGLLGWNCYRSVRVQLDSVAIQESKVLSLAVHRSAG